MQPLIDTFHVLVLCSPFLLALYLFTRPARMEKPMKSEELEARHRRINSHLSDPNLRGDTVVEMLGALALCGLVALALILLITCADAHDIAVMFRP